MEGERKLIFTSKKGEQFYGTQKPSEEELAQEIAAEKEDIEDKFFKKIKKGGTAGIFRPKTNGEVKKE